MSDQDFFKLFGNPEALNLDFLSLELPYLWLNTEVILTATFPSALEVFLWNYQDPVALDLCFSPSHGLAGSVRMMYKITADG